MVAGVAEPEAEPPLEEEVDDDRGGGEAQGAAASPSGTASCCTGLLSASAWSSLPCVASWTLCSILMLVYNKQLFSTGKFPFPLTLVLMHQLALSGSLWSLRIAAPTRVLAQLMPAAGLEIKRRDWVHAFVPIALLQAIAMACQNYALQQSSAHFVVMVSAAKPVLVWLLQVAFGLLNAHCMHLKILSFISLGVLTAVAGEVKVVLDGLVALLVAQVSEGVRLVLIQRSLGGKHELDAATMLSYSSPLCALALAPAAFFCERTRIRTTFEFEKLGLAMFGASIALAVLVNITGTLVIQKTDALMLTFAGILKDFIGIFVSASFLAETIMPSQMVGYSVAVSFMYIYRRFKQQESTLASESLCSVTASALHPLDLTRLASTRDAKGLASGPSCCRMLCSIAVAFFFLLGAVLLSWPVSPRVGQRLKALLK